MQEKIIREDLTTKDNLINCYAACIQIEGNVNLLSAAVKNQSIKFSDGVENNASPVNDKTENDKLCRWIKFIATCKKIIDTTGNFIKVLNEIMEYGVRNITFLAAQVIVKSVELITLRIKKLIVHLKMRIAEATKQLLMGCLAGKGSITAASLLAPVINLFQLISKLANGILIGVDTVLNLLPKNMTIDAEGMSFFMTPKSLSNTKMKIINPTKSIVDRLPEEIKMKIYEIIKQADKVNAIAKTGMIAASSTANAILASAGSPLDISKCSKLKIIDPMQIIRDIEAILMLILTPQPLPKYEKLSITNIGFLAWLITGFIPAGQKSFGLPGV